MDPTLDRLKTAEQAKQTIEDRDWVRWTSRNIEVNRKQILESVARFCMTTKYATRDGAGASCDDQFWLGHRLVGAQGCFTHVLGDRPSDQDPVCMSRRGDEVDAEAASIEDDIAQRIDLCLAAITAPGTDLAQAQRATQQAA